MATIRVACSPAEGGWRCEVSVGEDPGRSHHTVTVTREDLRRLDPAASEPRRLVQTSFEFLLEREPKESILRTFELPVIGRYFPEYEAQIRKRLAGR